MHTALRPTAVSHSCCTTSYPPTHTRKPIALQHNIPMSYVLNVQLYSTIRARPWRSALRARGPGPAPPVSHEKPPTTGIQQQLQALAAAARPADGHARHKGRHQRYACARCCQGRSRWLLLCELPLTIRCTLSRRVRRTLGTLLTPLGEAPFSSTELVGVDLDAAVLAPAVATLDAAALALVVAGRA